MELLNLTLGQFLVTFGGLAAVAVALYLLDRTRKRNVVASLRFWTVPGQPAPVSRNRRIQQKVSFLMQLLGMLLLLLAIAEFQFGGGFNKRRDHVLVLDSSAWMSASLPGGAKGTTLMDAARANALGWLRAVPPTDRVLVVRADGLATPATAWETDHRKILRAILETTPGSTALNLSQNLQFARDMQRRSEAESGEIVYSGPGRISAREAASTTLPDMPAFRVLPVDDAIENCGIRSVGARHSETKPGVWEILVRARNYGKRTRTVSITLNYGHAPQGNHSLDLPPGQDKETLFELSSRAAGILETRLYLQGSPGDGFIADNYAALELPEQRTLHVIVYTDQPAALRPALESDPRVRAEFRAKSAYTPENDGLVVLDRFRPEARPQGKAFWIDPPSDRAPIPVVTRVDHPEGLRWVPDQPLTQGLRARNSQIESTSVLQAVDTDFRVAEIEKGPVMLARGDTLVAGFSPFAGSMRYELSVPILVGNILRWASPDTFRDIDVGTQSAGAVSSPLARDADRKAVQVLTETGTVLPFNIRDRAVQFFAGEPTRVRVLSGQNERVYSLTLPEMWDAKWTAPRTARKGVPAWNDSLRRNRILWPWLALLGTGLLVAEWILYGSYRLSRLHVVARVRNEERAA
jgi:hypothetical protein